MLLNCTHKGRAGGSSSSQDSAKRINIHQVSVFMNKRMTADRRQEGAAATSGYLDTSLYASEVLLSELALISN